MTYFDLRAQSDSRLVELARSGSVPAFEAIVVRHRSSLVLYCARLIGPSDAEEAVQNALLQAHQALLRGDAVRELTPWLYAIAHNAALDCVRARAQPVRPAGPRSHLTADVDEVAAQHEEFREVLAAVASLEARQRAAFVMRELQGRTYQEIASVLGVSRGTVGQLLSRARTSLRIRSGRSHRSTD